MLLDPNLMAQISTYFPKILEPFIHIPQLLFYEWEPKLPYSFSLSLSWRFQLLLAISLLHPIHCHPSLPPSSSRSGHQKGGWGVASSFHCEVHDHVCHEACPNAWRRQYLLPQWGQLPWLAKWVRYRIWFKIRVVRGRRWSSISLFFLLQQWLPRGSYLRCNSWSEGWEARFFLFSFSPLCLVILWCFQSAKASTSSTWKETRLKLSLSSLTWCQAELELALCNF